MKGKKCPKKQKLLQSVFVVSTFLVRAVTTKRLEVDRVVGWGFPQPKLVPSLVWNIFCYYVWQMGCIQGKMHPRLTDLSAILYHPA